MTTNTPSTITIMSSNQEQLEPQRDKRKYTKRKARRKRKPMSEECKQKLRAKALERLGRSQPIEGGEGGLNEGGGALIIGPLADKKNLEKGALGRDKGQDEVGGGDGTSLGLEGVETQGNGHGRAPVGMEWAVVDKVVRNERILEVLVGERGEKGRMVVHPMERRKFGVGREVLVESLGGGLWGLRGRYNRWGMLVEGSVS